MASHFDRIKREVNAINRLNSTNMVLKFVLVLNIALSLLFSYSFYIHNSIYLCFLSLMVFSINTAILVINYE